MSQVVQLNVRMERELRDAGAGALASRGWSPSAFVRAAWARAAERGQGLAELLDAVAGEPDGGRQRPRGGDSAAATAGDGSLPAVGSAAVDPWSEADGLWAELCAYVGRDPAVAPPRPARPWEEELEAAAWESQLVREGSIEAWGDVEADLAPRPREQDGWPVPLPRATASPAPACGSAGAGRMAPEAGAGCEGASEPAARTDARVEASSCAATVSGCGAGTTP